jgi:hypothetical protein
MTSIMSTLWYYNRGISDSAAASPQSSDAIGVEGLLIGDEQEIFQHRLGDQHPVERVALIEALLRTPAARAGGICAYADNQSKQPIVYAAYGVG